MTSKPEYVYIAFDLFPSQKGAATHIDHCLKALQNTFSTGLLICLGSEEMPTFQFDADRKLFVYRFKKKIKNFLERTEAFQITITKLLKLPTLASNIKLVHFRDVWGGMAALRLNGQFRTVFEVNAFSHLELSNRYPGISPVVVEKIKKLEKYCISNSTVIITPSPVTMDFIISKLDGDKKKISVIPNGVTVIEGSKPQITKKSSYVLYFGAFQKWQGIKTLFKAYKELQDLDLRLMLCASVPEKRIKVYKELAKNIGIYERIDWFFELDKITLAQKIRGAYISVAPLTACDRNIVQGCNPLKILESMGYGTPVIASKLPVVEHLIKDNKTGFLVPPDRPQLLGRRVRMLYEQQKVVEEVGIMAQKIIEENYLWKEQESKMKKLYLNLDYV